MSAVRVLVVDDEPLNLEILAEYFGFEEEPSFSPVCIDRGEDAWDLLQDPGNQFDIILLDRMMPGMNGIELLRRIKATPRLAETPVILQTAADSAEQIREGLEAGAYYYLTKPYRRDALIAIVQAALTDAQAHNSLRRRLDEHVGALQFLSSANFHFRNLDEAGQLAAFLAQACPHPDRAILGISELLINAVEHGNLGLGYDEKARLKREDTLHVEIDRRLALAENVNKEVHVCFARNAKEITLRVADEGQGFCWQNFLHMSPERACDPNGRGIALASMLSFTRLAYEGCGNIAVATISSDAGTP